MKCTQQRDNEGQVLEKDGVKSVPLTIQGKTTVSDSNIAIRTMSDIMCPEQSII